MKRKFIKIFVLVGLSLLILTGCVAGPNAQGAPGVSANESSVYVSYQQYVYKIDTKTGAETWRFPASGSASTVFYAPPLVIDGNVYVGDFNKNFHNVADSTGQEIWVFTQAQGWYQTAPQVDGDLIFVPNTDRNMYALKADGTLSWKYSDQYGFLAQPVVVGDTVVIGSQNHEIIALNKTNGQEVWQHEMKGAIVAAPLYDSRNDTLYLGSLGKDFVALDSRTGELKWEYTSANTVSSIWASPVMINDQLLFSDEAGKVIGLDPQTGEFLWQIEAGGNMLSGVVATSNGFILALEDGTVTAYDFSRNPVWTKKINGTIFSTPAVFGETVYVGTISSDALVYAYDLNGTQLWSYKPAN